MHEGKARAPAPQRAPGELSPPASLQGWMAGQVGRRSPNSPTPGPPTPPGRGREAAAPRCGGCESSALQGSPRAARAPRPRRSFLCPGPPSAAAAERGCRRGAQRRCPVHQHHLGAVRVAGVAPRKGEEGCASIPWVTSWAWASRLSSHMVSGIRGEVTRIPNPMSSLIVWCHRTPGSCLINSTATGRQGGKLRL